MQDNEPLMRALSNLITVNSPDLVLFVGEALVGNDAVDQLTKFNQRLSDLATDAATAHTIDGILLTKFDTIDDKVRAKRTREPFGLQGPLGSLAWLLCDLCRFGEWCAVKAPNKIGSCLELGEEPSVNSVKSLLSPSTVAAEP